jgi:hypothetical protein
MTSAAWAILGVMGAWVAFGLLGLFLVMTQLPRKR